MAPIPRQSCPCLVPDADQAHVLSLCVRVGDVGLDVLADLGVAGAAEALVGADGHVQLLQSERRMDHSHW